MAALPSLSPADAHRLVADGATLIDIREPGEFAREHIAGSANHPLGRIAPADLPDGPLVFLCRSGLRTAGACDRLGAMAGERDAYLLEGGLGAWRAAGLPAETDRSQPIDIMRQVQIVAGSLVLTGIILGLLVAPAFFALSAFVGAGLTFAGISGWCGMARLLAVMPWNRRAAMAG